MSESFPIWTALFITLDVMGAVWLALLLLR